MQYYYPDNMAQEDLFGGFWNLRDLIILLIIFILAILTVVAFSFFYLFVPFILYAMFSAKIQNGYSITKVALLYIRFLITDKLTYYWRSD